MSSTFKTTIARISSAVLLLPLYFYLLYESRFYYLTILIVSTAVSFLCLYEFYQIANKGGKGKSFALIGLVSSLFINVAVYFYSFESIFYFGKYFGGDFLRIILFLVALLVAIIMSLQVFKRPIEGGIYSLGVTVFGVIFIAVFFSHLIMLRSLQNGFIYIVMLHVIIMVNDSAAYFGGVFFGKHKTGFAVSPNKSWEGYFFGVLFSIIGMILLNESIDIFWNLRLFRPFEAAVIGFVFSILGNIGDLSESAIKRDGKIKDSGSIIPGHGGLWDVFDALIFTMPLFYYYLKLKGVQ